MEKIIEINGKSICELKESYLKLIRENKIVENCTNVDVIAPDLHGDHFASSCDYVTIHYTDQDKGSNEKMDLFVKRMLVNPGVSDMINQLECFPKEAGFFNLFIPHLKSFISKRILNSGKKYELEMIPKCVFATDQIIMLENLVTKGYIVKNKLTRQDMNDATIVMKSLAKYHAPSYLMIKEQGIENILLKYCCLQDGYLREGAQKHIKNWLTSLLGAVRNVLQCNLSEENKDSIELIDKLLSKNILKYAQQSFRDGQICLVANHGDSWNNNMMFLLDENQQKVLHHVLIDFQEIRVGSPNLDISFYMFTSLKHSIRPQKWIEVLKIYYDSFVENVEFLNGNVDFSFEDFVQDYKKKFVSSFLYALSMTCSFEPMEGFGDLENIDGSVGEQMNLVIQKWIKEYPQRASILSDDLSGMLREFKNFVQGNEEFCL